MRELYAAELTFVDRWIGRLLNKMDDLGLMDNTVVMYLSDHGLTLGEYGILGKHAAYPNWPIYRVPYMIRHPEGERAGELSQYFASTHDVASTAARLQGDPGAWANGWRGPVRCRGLTTDKKPHDERQYFTACYARYLICGDGRWVLIAHSEEAAHSAIRHPRRIPRDRQPRRPEPGDRRALWRVLEEEAGGTLPQFGDEGVMGG